MEEICKCELECECEENRCEKKCEDKFDCNCDCKKDCEDLVCTTQCVYEDVELCCVCSIDCVCSYITETKIICFCDKPVLKICYAVEIDYTTQDCQKKKHTIYNTALFMSMPKCFDMCQMRATAQSFLCENTCCQEVKIKTVVKVCG